MKKIMFYSLLPLLAIIIFVAAQNSAAVPASAPEDIDLGWPEDVMVLLERSCFDCHTNDASNDKPKDALNFSKWEDYKLTKQVAKLNDISKMVKETKMPPEKYIEKYHDKKLSDAEIGVITNWANAEAEELMGE